MKTGTRKQTQSALGSVDAPFPNNRLLLVQRIKVQHANPLPLGLLVWCEMHCVFNSGECKLLRRRGAMQTITTHQIIPLEVWSFDEKFQFFPQVIMRRIFKQIDLNHYCLRMYVLRKLHAAVTRKGNHPFPYAITLLFARVHIRAGDRNWSQSQGGGGRLCTL